jgi:hypothetical protein
VLPSLNDAVANRDVLVQLPKNRVVLQQVPHRLGVAKIVDRNNLELTTALKPSPKKIPTNPPKPVDPHACFSHELSLNDAPGAVI